MTSDEVKEFLISDEHLPELIEAYMDDRKEALVKSTGEDPEQYWIDMDETEVLFDLNAYIAELENQHHSNSMAALHDLLVNPVLPRILDRLAGTHYKLGNQFITVGDASIVRLLADRIRHYQRQCISNIGGDPII